MGRLLLGVVGLFRCVGIIGEILSNDGRGGCCAVVYECWQGPSGSPYSGRLVSSSALSG